MQQIILLMKALKKDHTLDNSISFTGNGIKQSPRK